MSLMRKTTTGAALALAAAGLVGCMSTGGGDTMAKSTSSDVHCYGVNKCKGHNDCASANNSCKGMGSCKGQGFVAMPEGSCDAVGGSVGS